MLHILRHKHYSCTLYCVTLFTVYSVHCILCTALLVCILDDTHNFIVNCLLCVKNANPVFHYYSSRRENKNVSSGNGAVDDNASDPFAVRILSDISNP